MLLLVRESYSRTTREIVNIHIERTAMCEAFRIKVLDELTVTIEHPCHFVVGEFEPHFLGLLAFGHRFLVFGDQVSEIVAVFRWAL